MQFPDFVFMIRNIGKTGYNLITPQTSIRCDQLGEIKCLNLTHTRHPEPYTLSMAKLFEQHVQIHFPDQYYFFLLCKDINCLPKETAIHTRQLKSDICHSETNFQLRNRICGPYIISMCHQRTKFVQQSKINLGERNNFVALVVSLRQTSNIMPIPSRTQALLGG